MVESGNTKNVRIDYTNWRGERRQRIIRPMADGFRFTKNRWHSEQWLLTAFDVESGEIRAFAMAGIHSWLPATDARPSPLAPGCQCRDNFERDRCAYYQEKKCVRPAPRKED